MATTNILVHIGYHKTGTTWLQRNLFNNHDIGFCSPLTGRDIKSLLVHPNALDFDVEQCQRYTAPVFQQVRKSGLVPVISRERLSGSLEGGGYDSKEMADRLAAVFPQAKVLITIREQRSALLSSYKEIIKGGAPYTLSSYLTFSQRYPYKLPLFDIAHFKYHRLIDYYIHRFGAGNVLTLPYEMFRTEPVEYVRTILRFCSVVPSDNVVENLPFSDKSNCALSVLATELKRRLNALMIKNSDINPSTTLPFTLSNQQIKPLMYRFDDFSPQALHAYLEHKSRTMVIKHTEGFYQESNFLTAQSTGLDLANYGYDMPEPTSSSKMLVESQHAC